MRKIMVVGNWKAATPYEDNLRFSSSHRARNESAARAAPLPFLWSGGDSA